MKDKLPHFVSFYSFKGGVGRSMALLNVASSLAARGREVLIVDLDLEAPGISAHLDKNISEAARPRGDVVDLLTSLKAESAQRDENGDSGPESRAGARLNPFIIELPRSGHRIRNARTGLVHLVGAHLHDSSYLERLGKLRLGSMTKSELIRLGRSLRRTIGEARIPIAIPDYFPAEIVREKPYDYVLIDSRTGFTEIGGLCVGPLSDRVVVVLGLNDQNVLGTDRFIKKVGLRPVESPAAYFENYGTDWPAADGKPTILVASPVPNGELESTRARLNFLEKTIGRPVTCKLSYHPQLAIGESNFIRDFPDEHLAAEYRKLTDAVMQFFGDEAGQLARQLQAFISNKTDKLGEIQQSLAAEGKIKFQMVNARYYQLTKRSEKSDQISSPRSPAMSYAEAVSCLVKVYAEKAETAESLTQIFLDLMNSTTQLGLPQNDENVLKERTLDDFVATNRLFELLVELKDFEEWKVWANWGSALMYCAKELRPNNMDMLLKAARRNLDNAEQLVGPRDRQYALQSNAASILISAENSPFPEAEDFYREARDKLLSALALRPDSIPITRQIAHSLRDEARRRIDGAETDEMFSRAYTYYQAALNLDKYGEDAVSTIWSWARTLQFQASKKRGDEARKIFAAAYSKFTDAAGLAPHDPIIDSQWGEAMAWEAKTILETGTIGDIVQAADLVARAIAKLKRFVDLGLDTKGERNQDLIEARAISSKIADCIKGSHIPTIQQPRPLG